MFKLPQIYWYVIETFQRYPQNIKAFVLQITRLFAANSYFHIIFKYFQTLVLYGNAFFSNLINFILAIHELDLWYRYNVNCIKNIKFVTHSTDPDSKVNKVTDFQCIVRILVTLKFHRQDFTRDTCELRFVCKRHTPHLILVNLSNENT